MSKLNISIDLEDLVSELIYQGDDGASFTESVKSEVVMKSSKEIVNLISEQQKENVAKEVYTIVSEFVEKEMPSVILGKIKQGEVQTKYNGLMTFDQIIEKHMSSQKIESVITNHIDKKLSAFTKDLQSRYDNVFAAKVVKALNENGMLRHDISALLLGD